MTLRMQVPDAPKNLWRKMLKKVTNSKGQLNRGRLNMGYWHAFEKKYDDYVNLEMAETKKEVACSTVHCMAGWTTVLTPGGIELENKLRKKLGSDTDQAEKLFQSVSEYAGEAEGEVGLAALLILEKAGWSEHVTWSHFVNLTESSAMKLIRKLAKMEGERAKKRKR